MVVVNGSVWALMYFGFAADNHARELLALGRDPLHFHKTAPVLIDIGAKGSIDDLGAHKPALIYWHGDLYHFYTAVSSIGNERGIAVARSRPW